MLTHSTYVAGAKFRPQHDREVFESLEEGGALTLEPDPNNKFDPFAVKILAGGSFVGFIPKDLAPEVGDLIKAGRIVSVVKGQGNKVSVNYEEQQSAAE